ncbi:hypothetical protein [Providencia stuartii]|uniref:hypothetical protein n=1 Tax=Providencia stuartii TaxID=588 RepID=UPI0034E4B614
MSIEQSKQNEKQTQLDWWFIGILSFLPIIIPFSKKLREKAKITSDSLDNQNLFWISIFTPIIYFFLFGLLAWIGTDIDFNYQGFNKFLEISKLPLGILAFSPIFAVIVSNIHRSIQTDKQIDVTENKNLVDSYYSHVKFITENLEKVRFKAVFFKMKFNEREEKEFHPIIAIDSNINRSMSLYSNIFNDSNHIDGANLKINEQFIMVLKQHLDKLLSDLNELETFFNGIHRLEKQHSVIDRTKKLMHSINNTLAFLGVGKTAFTVYDYYQSHARTVDDYLKFDFYYRTGMLPKMFITKIEDIFDIIGYKENLFQDTFESLEQVGNYFLEFKS